MSFGSFPPASKMLLQKEQDKNYSLHRRRMCSVKSQIDNNPPRQHAHLLLRLKQLQSEEEKKARIDRENKLLLSKMTQIMLSRDHRKGRGRKDTDMKASLNQEYRDRIQERINAENVKIAKRIEKVKPIYDVDKWENDYRHKQRLKEMWGKTTKDFQSPRTHKDEDDDYDSDFESDEETRKENKLPPISKRSNNRGNDTDRSDGRQDKQNNTERELYMYYGLKRPRDLHDSRYDVTEGSEHSKRDRGKTNREKDETSDVKQLFRISKEMINPPHEVFVKCLANKSYAQRMSIADEFQEEYDLELSSELKKGLGNEWTVLIDALLQKEEGNSSEKAQLTKGLKVTDAVSLTTRLAPLSNQEISDLKEQYMKENSTSLESEISKRHKDPVRQFLLTLVKGSKDENGDVDEQQAENDAKDLLQFGEGRWTSANGKFMRLLESKSSSYVSSVLEQYKAENKGKPAMDAIKEECSADYTKVINAYITSSEQNASQELEQIHNNMDANHPQLVEIIVSKSETGFGSTNKAYKSKYGKELAVDLETKSSHTTTPVLIAIINKKPEGKKTKGGKKAKQDTSGQRKKSYPRDENDGRHGTKSQTRQEPVTRDARKETKTKDESSTGVKAESAEKTAGGSDDKSKQDKSKDKLKAQSDGQQSSKNQTKDSTKSDDVTDDDDDDVKRLYEAMDGLGTNEDDIINIIVNRSNAKRQDLRKAYKYRYKQDLLEDLKSDLSGDLEEVILALVMRPVEYDAYCLHESMSGAGTDETILIGIVCSKKTVQLADIKKQYKKAYNTELESDIRGDTSGNMQDLLIKLISGDREQGKDVDKEKADKDATALHENPSGKALKDVLINNSRAQLKATEDAYKKLYKEDMIDAVKKSSSGDAEDAFIAIVEANRDIVHFYTRRIRSALEGMGTNDTQLIRILVSRSEIDLPAIKAKYKELYGHTLRQDVEDDTSGDYKQTLLKILDTY